MRSITLASLMSLALLTGCAGQSPDAIRDLAVLPQDSAAYVPAGQGNVPLLAPERQKALAQEYRAKYYAPWQHDAPAVAAADVLAPFAKYAQDPGFGANGVKLPPRWADGLLAQAGLKDYPNRKRPAITLRHTDLRELPTLLPRFKDFASPADGYPFDTLQNTGVWANTPILVLHLSAMRDWAFVQAPYASGWMPSGDLAYVDDKFVAAWQARPLVAAIRDEVPIVVDGRYQFTARLGCVLPSTGGMFLTGGAAPDKLAGVLVAVGDADGAARIVEGVTLAAHLREFPVPLTATNLARLADDVLGQPYCWGGMYQGRDCSATTRDLFTPFGLWLPRDSVDQARCGKFIPFKDMPDAQKEKAILDQGKPFLTLIRSPGHIMLYIGPHAGRALVLHNFWGVATRDAAGRETRHNVGRCVITTLQPGLELPDILLPKGDYRSRAEGMTILGEDR